MVGISFQCRWVAGERNPTAPHRSAAARKQPEPAGPCGYQPSETPATLESTGDVASDLTRPVDADTVVAGGGRDPRVAVLAALAVYRHRIRRYVGAYTAQLGGLSVVRGWFCHPLHVARGLEAQRLAKWLGHHDTSD